MVHIKLQKMREDKASNVDKMSPRFLKSMHKLIVRPVNLLLQKSLDKGHVPLDWKMANFMPIFKKR